MKALSYLFVIFAFLAAGIPVPVAAQEILAPPVREALERISAGKASDADRALLFSNNDGVNSARLNGEITDRAYQAAQRDFADLNKRFAQESARAAGADFTVQKSSSKSFSPGTDSDYITMVKDKKQIANMQRGYNSRVNEFLANNGVESGRTDWHNKLDTDFMADPRHITDPADFRDIAKMNNDAYKNRFAAEYEKISRAKDASRIGPAHVNGYMEEMNDFAAKKSGHIDDMLAKGPSHFSDPANRAELFRTMAQEQKYISRLEALDDHLRAQEGLPPRGRGNTLAAQGSARGPGTALATKEAHASAAASRLGAMEDIAETMSQVARKNPSFNPNAADDIAKIIEGLPSERRAGALARIRANDGQKMVDSIVSASTKSGRIPAGKPGLGEALAKGIKGAPDPVPGAGMRKLLGDGAAKVMEVVGRLGAAYDVASAAFQLNDYYKNIMLALDPTTSAEEADAALTRAEKIAKGLAEAGIIGAITEASPTAAVALGTWTLTRHGGEWILANTKTGQKINRFATGFFRMNLEAWDAARDWWTGKAEKDEEHARNMCSKFMQAVRDEKVKLRKGYKVLDVCNAFRKGELVSAMIELAEVGPDDVKTEPVQALAPASCDVSANRAAIADLKAKAGQGGDEISAHVALLERVNGDLAAVDAAYEVAKKDYVAGRFDKVSEGLEGARARLAALGGSPDCPDLATRLDNALEKNAKTQDALAETAAAIKSCEAAPLAALKERYAALSHSGLAKALARAEALSAIHGQARSAAASYKSGDIAAAYETARAARDKLSAIGAPSCAALAGGLKDLVDGLAGIRELAAEAQGAISACNVELMQGFRGELADISQAWAVALRARLSSAIADCQKAAAEVSERPDPARLAALREANCRQRFGEGYRAGQVLEDGRHVCLPSKEVADAVCRAKHGDNVQAGTIRADGSYNCFLTPAAQREAAVKECRRLYGKKFIRLVSTKQGLRCEYARGATHSAKNSAAVLTAIGGIIGAIAVSKGHGSGSSSGCCGH
ncbi:MAG: hypothetical protein KDJ46_06845 [Rhodobiaceae bacterium]|nr:hypothetical protein [Rhodobiaceae bacterium]